MGPALGGRGYRVVAVDLRGHGLSGRAGSYTAQDHADDLAETLPRGAELALGHSLGGLTLSLAAERLAPRRAVYAEPAWYLGVREKGTASTPPISPSSSRSRRVTSSRC